MTQCIIPGCEEHPDPKNVIDVTQKEDGTMDRNNDKTQNAFDTLLVSSANAAESGRELIKENERLSIALAEAEAQLDEQKDVEGRLALLDRDEDILSRHSLQDRDDLEYALEAYEKFKDLADEFGCVQISDADELREKFDAERKPTLRAVLPLFYIDEAGIELPIFCSTPSVAPHRWKLHAPSATELAKKLETTPLLDGRKLLDAPVEGIRHDPNLGAIVTVVHRKD